MKTSFASFFSSATCPLEAARRREIDVVLVWRVRRTIREMATNRTILLSTHILQEVKAVADRVILIHRGRAVFDGTPHDMQAGHATLDDAFFALTNPAPIPAAPAAEASIQ